MQLNLQCNLGLNLLAHFSKIDRLRGQEEIVFISETVCLGKMSEDVYSTSYEM
jgi:hypothetical protein